MKFSVVIPCYNAGHRITEALDSVLRQSHAAEEVIVVDDGSTDDSAERIAAHKASTHQLQSDRGGPAGARNVGIHAATGDAIAFLDADDQWNEDHLASAAKMLADNETVATMSNCSLLFESSGKVVNRQRDLLSDRMQSGMSHNTFAERFAATGVFCQPSVVVRREVVGKGYDESLWGPEDIEFFMRVIFDRKWGYNPAPTVIYRADTPSSVSKQRVRQQTQMLNAMEKVGELGYDTQHMDELLRQAARRAIVTALTYGDGYDVAELWKRGQRYLKMRERWELGMAKAFPGVFRPLNLWRHAAKEARRKAD